MASLTTLNFTTFQPAFRAPNRLGKLLVQVVFRQKSKLLAAENAEAAKN